MGPIVPPSRTTNRKAIREAIEASDLPSDLTGIKVTVDWSDADAVTPSAVDESMLVLIRDRNAAAVVVIANTADIADTVTRIAERRGWADRVSTSGSFAAA